MYICIIVYIYVHIYTLMYNHICAYVQMYIYAYIYINTFHHAAPARHIALYGVATISRILKIIGLFCKRAL